MASRTLNLNGLLKLKIDQDLIESSFDRISRYYITARVIKALENKENSKVLDVGGLGTILPRLIKNKITILDVDPNPDSNYVQGDATKQPFEDGAFDVVVTCDTLEHIPKTKRKDFIEELVRVSKDLVIIGAPFDHGEVVQSEKDLNNFYKKLSGKEHRWLKEHIDIGLPTEKSVEQVLNNLPVHWGKFGHTNIEVWRALVEANFISECLEIESLRKEIGDLNELYNTQLLDKDFGNDSYRLFYVISKTDSIKIIHDKPKELILKTHVPLLRRVHEAYAKIIDTTGHGLIEKQAELNRTIGDLRWVQKEVKELRKQLSAIYNSKGWQILDKVYTTKKRLKR